MSLNDTERAELICWRWGGFFLCIIGIVCFASLLVCEHTMPKRILVRYDELVKLTLFKEEYEPTVNNLMHNLDKKQKDFDILFDCISSLHNEMAYFCETNNAPEPCNIFREHYKNYEEKTKKTEK